MSRLMKNIMLKNDNDLLNIIVKRTKYESDEYYLKRKGEYLAMAIINGSESREKLIKEITESYVTYYKERKEYIADIMGRGDEEEIEKSLNEGDILILEEDDITDCTDSAKASDEEEEEEESGEVNITIEYDDNKDIIFHCHKCENKMSVYKDMKTNKDVIDQIKSNKIIWTSQD